MLQYSDKQIYILVDDNTKQYCLPIFLEMLQEKYGWNINTSHIFTISPGEEHKTIGTVCALWHALVEQNVTRNALLFNLGGGVITDLGGFVASTYRRGIDYINVPTTLLSMVDAGFGGKTGFDFDGLKNAIGTFKKPVDIWIEPCFLKTLPREELLSGYAEMVKHALLANHSMLEETLKHIGVFLEIDRASQEDLLLCEQMLWDSINIKQNIVALDPTETGVRKSLNLGHTIGHALEELSFVKGSPLRHGFAVMQGLVAELFISCKIKGLHRDVLTQMSRFMVNYYIKQHFEVSDFDQLFGYMQSDKKNRTTSEINFTLLTTIGDYKVDNVVNRELIEESLIYLRGINYE